MATISAIKRAGLRPYFADVDAENFTLDPESVKRSLEAARNENDPIQALVAVHLYGQPCFINRIQDLCTEYEVKLVEDCSQAHGAQWNGRKVGGFGIAGAFSLYPTKNLGAIGDAGVVTTNNRELADKMRLMRQYGWKQQGISTIPGMNSRLDPLQAAILRVKLPLLEENNKHRQAIAKVYREAIKDSKKIQPLGRGQWNMCITNL